MKILLLEDELMLSRSICTYLLSCNYFVDQYDNGQDVLESVEIKQYDFYILDINTPLVSGLECLEVIARKYPNTPKIIISAYHDIESISSAFSLGCSDYLKKPFNLKELKIRIDNLCLVRTQTAPLSVEQTIQIGEKYLFNRDTNILFYDGKAEQFTKREHALILLFISNLDQIITDENIRSVIWDGEHAESATIRSLVNRVRSKLKEELVHNIRGFGYTMKRVTHG